MRGRSGKRLRKAHNGLRIDLTLLSRPFRRVGGNKFGQFGKTRGVSVHIILVIELAGNKRVDDAQIEGIVRTWADKQKIIGLGGRNIVADINDRELAAFAQGLHDGSGLAKVDGFKNVARLQYNVLAVGKVVHGHAAAEAHDSLAGVVGVEVARGAVRTDVGRTDAAHKGAVQVGKGAIAVRPQHCFLAVLLLDCGNFLRNIVKGFFPRNLFPLALAPLAHTNKRALRALRLALKGFASHAARAQGTLEGTVRVAVNHTHGTIFYFYRNWTPCGAHSAYTLNQLHTAHSASLVRVSDIVICRVTSGQPQNQPGVKKRLFRCAAANVSKPP